MEAEEQEAVDGVEVPLYPRGSEQQQGRTVGPPHLRRVQQGGGRELQEGVWTLQGQRHATRRQRLVVLEAFVKLNRPCYFICEFKLPSFSRV